MKLSRALVVASLLVGTAVLTACPGMNLTGGIQVPTKGTAVTQEIYAKFLPTPKVGQKWTYAVAFTAPGDEPERATMSTEVTQVDGDVMTTFQSTLGEGATEPLTATSTASISKPMFLSEGATMTSGGAEDVTVPAKTYPGAAKFLHAKDGKTVSTLWLVPGVGMVKASSGDAESGLYTMELKEFKQP